MCGQSTFANRFNRFRKANGHVFQHTFLSLDSIFQVFLFFVFGTFVW
jgi:hypothetical protein